MSGVKHDQGKTRYELLPPEFLEAVASILTFGAQKYADRNWERGIKYSRVFGALMRHLWAWWRGNNLDDETGKSHLWHAGCCLAFLITYETRNMSGFDDRPAHGDKAGDNVLPSDTQAPPSKGVPAQDAQSICGGGSGLLVQRDSGGPVGRVQVGGIAPIRLDPSKVDAFLEAIRVVEEQK